jgi:hypothetical protein
VRQAVACHMSSATPCSGANGIKLILGGVA